MSSAEKPLWTGDDLEYWQGMVAFHKHNLKRLLADLESPMEWYSYLQVKHWIKLERTRLKRAELGVRDAEKLRAS